MNSSITYFSGFITAVVLSDFSFDRKWLEFGNKSGSGLY